MWGRRGPARDLEPERESAAAELRDVPGRGYSHRTVASKAEGKDEEECTHCPRNIQKCASAQTARRFTGKYCPTDKDTDNGAFLVIVPGRDGLGAEDEQERDYRVESSHGHGKWEEA